MTTILFWNCKSQPVGEHLASVAQARDVHLIVLAESPPVRGILAILNATRKEWVVVRSRVASRIVMLVRGVSKFVIPLYDLPPRCRISKVSFPAQAPLTVVAVHMSSKLHSDDFDRNEAASEFAQAVCAVEAAQGHHRTVVIGDFNMNPFERGMVSAKGFNAVTPVEIARNGSRRHDFADRQFFYNPMWNFFSEREGRVPGTYFHRSPGGKSIYWNILDQVLLRPQLIPHFDLDGICIISETSVGSLIDSRGRPNLSDHLPIMLTLKQ